MAILIPALTTCLPRMTSGEKRTAERLEQKLEDDYLIWYDVPVGPKQAHPDFVLLHPRRGLLVLEVKDWRLDTIKKATRQYWEIMPGGDVKVVINPLAQARHCAIQVVNALERDRQLVQPSGSHAGKLAFPWGYGVVLSNITRRQFEASGLDQAIESHLVVCRDEMFDTVDDEVFQQRLWDMFPHSFGGAMSLPQLDRVRWIMFPEVRVQTQADLFDDLDEDAELPDVMKVMDLQQEQLARSLGDGHRVIHGVAGSGKTMILGYRAEYLAKAQTLHAKPILVLCFNEPLSIKLDTAFRAKGIADRVHAVHFHRWCHRQLTAYGQALPQGKDFFDDMVDAVIRAVDRKQIPSGQYQAILIDEGHDFRPEWLKLITHMVDPATNSLLLLYDDAQSIYQRGRSKQFSFKSVGIQAQGRTTILKINYRNTRQILQTANLIAADLLTPEDRDDDGIPVVKPIGCGREGSAPIVVRLPSLRDEAWRIAELLKEEHDSSGHPWGDMAILCRDHAAMNVCAQALSRMKLPHQVRKNTGDYQPVRDVIRVMTMKVSKGLEFPVVAVPGAGSMPAPGEDEKEEARLFYVAATRATHKLIVTVSGNGQFGEKLMGA
ncbi:NERD domain-containing protein/DEAD/DEAH box helicase [uncultured Aquabacterium sp.]|uniref:DEAD/DEAH box helicase n=1 Tax=Aquabacterium sp. TaxID=1872578 RepID=UPI0025F08E8B|nr:NERD domain-containing protein/DEAD/DEAH box helicase [uncultured Aquabacterium sp.]